MKKYSVIQIADILDTNPETVRRWIRDDKLEAEQTSRKQGNTVTETALQEFLKGSPKYAARFAASEASMPKGMEVKIVPKIQDKRESKAVRSGVVSVRPHSTKGVFASEAALKSFDRPGDMVRVSANAGTAKGLAVEAVAARIKYLRKEMDSLNRILKTMESDARAMGVKKK